VTNRLSIAARQALATTIADAGGREVSFVAELDGDGAVVSARAVARGTVDAVLALPGVCCRGQMMLHNHPSGVLEPSTADLNVAVRLHDAGVGFGIVDNEGERLYVVVEVPQPRRTGTVDAVAVAQSLGPGGSVALALRLHEDRPSQRDMAAYVADVFNDGGVALLEAGTGVGKSFAYLVPAILWAIANDERTVVSTNTINLQEQLVGKDLPLLARALSTKDRPVRYALLKGWRNYVCLSRLQQARASFGSLLEPDRRDELDAIHRWSQTTGDGSRSDLPFMPSEEVWDEVAAESDLCSRLKCRHFDRCFVFAARRRAADADVVVVNHHLLASDLAVRRAAGNWEDAAVLPPYRRLILDEGHHLEETAAEHLGRRATSRGLERQLARLERGGGTKGLLPALRAAIAAEADPAVAPAALEFLAAHLAPKLPVARRAAELLFGVLERYMAGRADNVARLGDDFAGDPVWREGLEQAYENLNLALAQLRDALAGLIGRIEEGDGQPGESLAALCAEARGVAARLDGARDAIGAALRPPPGQPPTVRWLERRGGVGASHVALATAPLELAPLLKESLFDRVESVVVTSATLAAGGDFGFLAGRLGVDLAPVRHGPREILPSPFNFRDQCLFVIPDDVPEPSQGESAHDTRTAEVIADLAQCSDGGLFALFTSHRALRRVASLLRQGDCERRWPLLVQGEAPRDRLLARFRENGSAILLGTDSFWEGVDVPGFALRALVLAKLPFRVPTEPLTAARLEAVEAQGGNAFTDYLVPLAALKLKQGFGRLIRSRTDVGVVVLLDPRVVRKRYGAMLLEGLPPAERVVGRWDELKERITAFFELHAGVADETW
jgi:ATP-dependent DNA helicase DinG